MPVFFIPPESVHGRTVTIRGPLVAHLHNSLRYRTGDTLMVADESRRRYQVKLDTVSKSHLTGCVLETIQGPSAAPWPVTVIQAVLKHDKMAWMIQKATELGVDCIAPVLTQRLAHPVPSAQFTHVQQRWQRIATEAAQQSEQWAIPKILPPRPFTAFLQECRPERTNMWLLAERGETPRHGEQSIPQIEGKDTWLAIGPEGGWADEEVTAAMESGYAPVSLGSMILRSETAAIAALAMVQTQRGILQPHFTAPTEPRSTI